MAVYVDDMYRYPMGRLGRMKMSHMMADTTEELLAMATTIGIDHKHLQDAGTRREHFDVSKGKRWDAIVAGAQEVTVREILEFSKNRGTCDEQAK